MAKRSRPRNHSAAFKAKVALKTVRGTKTIGERAKQYEVHCNLIIDWKTQLREKTFNVFGAAAPAADVRRLHATIGQLKLEVNFF